MHDLLSTSSADDYTAVLRATTDIVADRFRTVRQPYSGASRDELQSLVDAVDLDGAGVGTAEAVRELDDLYLQHAVWFHDPAYLAHLNCPVALPAVAAEALIASVNTSVDTYDQSAIGTLMERRLIEWTAARIGFDGGDGVFTSGGTQSNLHALLLAREWAIARHGGDRTRLLPRLVVLATASSHFSVEKSALILGLSEDAVLAVPDDGEGRMDPHALGVVLETLRASGRVPMAVVATAGTTDRGVIDPIDAIADHCGDDIWLHVDAAYGCGLLVSRRLDLVRGIHRARSVTVDYHKSFFQPVSSSAIIVREPVDLAAASWHADYLNPRESDDPNQVDKSLQTTRRFDALKLWTTLRALGPGRLGEMFDAVIDLAAQVGADIAADDELELVGETQLSTVLFRVRPAGTDAAAQDALVAGVRRVLFESGRALVAKTVIDGRPCLKLTLLNPEVTRADVARVLALVKDAAATLAGIAPELDDELDALAGAEAGA